LDSEVEAQGYGSQTETGDQQLKKYKNVKNRRKIVYEEDEL
jgi:hypothetical protein